MTNLDKISKIDDGMAKFDVWFSFSHVLTQHDIHPAPNTHNNRDCPKLLDQRIMIISSAGSWIGGIPLRLDFINLFSSCYEQMSGTSQFGCQTLGYHGVSYQFYLVTNR